jgi:sporulation protein YlmC with PRC-barrel domain
MLQTITDLKRYSVFNRRGDKIGTIDDIMLDGDDWSIAYAVLRERTAVPGTEAKLHAVALDALAFDSENECFIVAADPDSVASARGFDPEAPPRKPDPRFRNPENA